MFDCYQSTHARNTESALKKARYVASFIRYLPKQALFVGLYEVRASRPLSVEAYQNRPLHRELMSFGMGGHKASDGRDSVLEFDLIPTNWHTDWSERLIVDWPGLERSWYRWANRNSFPVAAITEESCLIAPIPSWDDLVVDWHQLALLPAKWKDALSHWRGIYLIIDKSDGLQYVGSAYGRQNILQRWTEYARSGHGGNKNLKKRESENLRFSILQRTSPDLSDTEVIALEQTWKRRLRSQMPFGLNEN